MGIRREGTPLTNNLPGQKMTKKKDRGLYGGGRFTYEFAILAHNCPSKIQLGYAHGTYFTWGEAIIPEDNLVGVLFL